MSDIAAGEQPDPATRGALHISPRAMQTIATAAIRGTGAASPDTGGVAKLTGRSLPRADVVVRDHHARADVTVAITWPAPAAPVAAAVRHAVATDLTALCGYTVERVDVDVRCQPSNADDHRHSTPVPQLAAAATPTSSTADAPVSAAPGSPSPVEAKQPRAMPAATPLAALMAALLIGAGVVAAREALIDWGAINTTAWVAPVIENIDGLRAKWWMLPAGAAAAIVGVMLIVTAVKPRRRTHRRLTLDGVWLRRRDLRVLCAATAAATPGVAAVRVGGSARKLKLTVTPAIGADQETLPQAVTTAAAAALAILHTVPKVAVSTTKAHRA